MKRDEASVVLVTNVGQGFGRAIALAYGQRGFDVVCADKDVDLASKTAAEIEELGGQAIPIQADMTTQMDVKNAFDKVFEIFGDLSGVVHVASSESQTSFRELSEGEFSELFVDNVRSTFLILKMSERLLERAWLVLVTPPKSAAQPHMLSIRGAMTRMAAAFEARVARLTVNVVIPSRPWYRRCSSWARAAYRASPGTASTSSCRRRPASSRRCSPRCAPPSTRTCARTTWKRASTKRPETTAVRMVARSPGTPPTTPARGSTTTTT
jgi:NAD(P)-dependent dehydrogenase (short-subunit alcohol dehydrogenase family)